MDNQSIRSFIQNFDEGKYDAVDTKTQCDAGWYDWFCRDTSLAFKTKKLTRKLKVLLKSQKINQDTMYVFFKNNCPMDGSLYDDFRICDLETGDVIFAVVPSSGFNSKKGTAELWGRENGFDGPLVEGSWKDVKAFFLKGE